MRAKLLIARREYLSYVATWGFWISVISVPVIYVIIGALAVLIQTSQPTRYYVVIDETGQGYDDVVEARLSADQREAARQALEALARTQGGEAAEAALAAFPENGRGLEGLNEALALLGAAESAEMFASGFGRRIRVAAPAQTPEGLRPYLIGEATVATGDGPQPLFAAIFIQEGGERPLRLDYYSTNLTDTGLKEAARAALETELRRERLRERGFTQAEIEGLNALAPPVRDLNPEAEGLAAGEAAAEVTLEDRLPYFVAIGLSFILWIALFSVANMLLTSLVEEKGGKILDVLLSTARYHDVLIGKLLGVAGVSLTLFAIWGGLGAGLAIAGQQVLAQAADEGGGIIGAVLDPGLLLPALGYFIVGYLMYGILFLAIGSLCESLQEAQTLLTPMVFLMMAPFLVVAFSFETPDSVILRFASWVPIWTPFVMPARLPTDPPLWELAATTGLMLAAMVLIIALAGLVFRQGALGQANVDSVKRVFRFGRRAQT